MDEFDFLYLRGNNTMGVRLFTQGINPFNYFLTVSNK